LCVYVSPFSCNEDLQGLWSKPFNLPYMSTAHNNTPETVYLNQIIPPARCLLALERTAKLDPQGGIISETAFCV
jgi:hypothetical protein